MVRGVRGVRVVQAMQRVAANPIPAPNGQSTLSSGALWRRMIPKAWAATGAGGSE